MWSEREAVVKLIISVGKRRKEMRSSGLGVGLGLNKVRRDIGRTWLMTSIRDHLLEPESLVEGPSNDHGETPLYGFPGL